VPTAWRALSLTCRLFGEIREECDDGEHAALLVGELGLHVDRYVDADQLMLERWSSRPRRSWPSTGQRFKQSPRRFWTAASSLVSRCAGSWLPTAGSAFASSSRDLASALESRRRSFFVLPVTIPPNAVRGLSPGSDFEVGRYGVNCSLRL